MLLLHHLVKIASILLCGIVFLMLKRLKSHEHPRKNNGNSASLINVGPATLFKRWFLTNLGVVSSTR